jgi:predicted dehydrogenase
MSKKLKAGVIGLGVGERHIEAYQEHPDCEVVAACDFNKEKLAEVADRKPGIAYSENADDILTNPEINVVSIASFDNFHCEQILKAFEHDKHVFVEKPLCLYEEEATRIREALKSKPHLKMSSNLILRKSPRFNRLKRMINTGEMGDLSYLEAAYNYGRLEKIAKGWRGKLDFYSVTYGGGVHMIDLLQWLTEGDEIEEVSAYGNNIASKGTDFKHNDLVLAMLKFKSGLIARLTCNFGCVFPHFHELNVYGTSATFINTSKDALLYKSRDPKVEPEKVTEAYREFHKGELLLNFLDSINGKAEAEIDAEDIFRCMSVCFAVEKAMNNGSPVKVNYI